MVATLTFEQSLALAMPCSPGEIREGTCIAANLNNDSATLGGTVSTPGTDPMVDYSGGEVAPENPLASCIYIINDRCVKRGPGQSVPVQPVTLSDIASFRPDAASQAMEPNGWAVTGLATNFMAASVSEVHDGTLLGQAASVRFTPVAWHWDYGDGTVASPGTGGASWAAWGIPEFEQTPTSHTFGTPGAYTVQLVVDYRAEYRVGAIGWTPIDGTLSRPAGPLTVTVGAAKTVLVGRECTGYPVGPGC